jgi:flavin-dependent dehydrogenase
MQPVRDVLIVGGGLAGLTSAIHLSRAGLHVTVVEKHQYPGHKVCGEYISNEVLPYLQWLGADPIVLEPAQINRVCISAVSGKMVETRLPIGGFGISRYSLDQFLMQQAVKNGCEIMEDTVTDILFQDNSFTVSTTDHGILPARFVLGAYGKRAALDQQLGRSFLKERSPWLAIKGHYRGTFPNGLVALHNFRGGYCGVSKVENDIINICYLVNYNTFKQFKNIDTHREEVLYQNKHLKQVFENSQPLFERPLTISQVSFAKKEKIHQHIVMTGDTAGLIHPLCGNGMAMAIHSAKIASEQILKGLKGNRNILESSYAKMWKREFGKRITAGKLLSALFMKDRLSGAVMKGFVMFPALLPVIIRQTHGRPLKIDECL